MSDTARSHSNAVANVEHGGGTTPAWVTVSITLAVLARTVQVPVLGEEEVFAVAAAVNVAPSEPDDGVHFSHDALEETDHEVWFVATTAVADPAAELGAQTVCDNDTLGTAPAWVTVKVALAVPA